MSLFWFLAVVFAVGIATAIYFATKPRAPKRTKRGNTYVGELGDTVYVRDLAKTTWPPWDQKDGYRRNGAHVAFAPSGRKHEGTSSRNTASPDLINPMTDLMSPFNPFNPLSPLSPLNMAHSDTSPAPSHDYSNSHSHSPSHSYDSGSSSSHAHAHSPSHSYDSGSSSSHDSSSSHSSSHDSGSSYGGDSYGGGGFDGGGSSGGGD